MTLGTELLPEGGLERLGIGRSQAEPALALRGRALSGLSQAEFAAAMIAVRRVEEEIRELRLSGEILGSVHLGIGQEAIPIGALSALESGDPVFATYRGHMWALACGTPLGAVFGELLARRTGVNSGRAGSAMFSDVAHAFYGENSIVGAGAPLAAGSALAAKYRGDDTVTVAVFGDGAMNQGSVNETLNFAAAFRLPLIFICENNRYSEMTLIADVVKGDQLYRRAEAFGIPGLRVDGNDPQAISDAVHEAAAGARAGEGPIFIEAMTERLVGHYIGDAEQYRRPHEVDELKKDEPIERMRRSLGGQAIAEIEAEVVEIVHAAAQRALGEPLSDPAAVKDHLYGDRK